MNDPIFTGELEGLEVVPYTVNTEDGKTERQSLCIRLRTNERYPQRVMFMIYGSMVQQFLEIPLQQMPHQIVAYLNFRLYDYERNGVKKTGQEVRAWRLEVTLRDGRLYVLTNQSVPSGLPVQMGLPNQP